MTAAAPTGSAPGLLDEGFLPALAQRAQGDGFVARHRTLADLKIGFHDSERGHSGWIAVTPQGCSAGVDNTAPFRFVGDTAALRDLAAGLPFNRLVRQHRLNVEGDLRACVQNWLLIYAVLRLCAPGSH